MCRLIVDVVLVITCVCQVTCRHPVVNIGAVFADAEYEQFQRTFYAAISDFNNSSERLKMYGKAMVAQGDFYDTVTSMCSMLESRSFHLLIVFGNTTTVHSVNVMAQYLDIPVIGYSRQADDEYFQLHHPLYLSLMPSKAHLAEGLARLMSVNYWYRYTMVIQEEIKDDGFHVELKSLTQTQNWDIEEELIISNTATDNEIANQLVPIGNNNSRIFVLHTSAQLAMRILDQANRLHFTGQEFAWIVTENAYTRNAKDLQHFPPGTLAFMLNLALNEDELLKDTMTLITTAIKERRHLGSSMSLNQKKGCWHLQNHEKSPMDNKLYKALIDTTIYGLTGSLKFDTGGYLNISSFKVRNLVFDGRGNVWRDIGCIQGDDVRPFGIIWPGDASSPDSKTQGRKRYRVVTNPVQPFVMQEAPHKDYQRCVTDTTCLKLFSKDKAKTIAAIRDYEQQIYRENKTYEIHCCRGLAIDLLNKLASDLDFDFTLFIVQDETYGRKVNGSWNGMVRDLMDGTAHFAVGAFSITRVRSEVIDFTDPYFFSGFSILYSEKTRETNMDAFLEPFALQVWFAIFVSATLSAIAMALFEWNSPFGLNPWGRKRKSNYTLASGLTMVYSVLFGHTVKTKSPKAWPSKVMQNFWAFAAIFIIASYTANLAAFIAGKHAGIDYTDIGDSRLLDIRIGLLPGSAVGGFLEKISSKLYAMSTAVPTTDTAIEMIIGEKIDAYLGDYPILDYARAHLAPRCELKLLLKIFGDDRYGFGLPKGSPLKVALSRKILEYHQNSQIEDLIDVHFADSQCYKQRISQQESSLEVTHHAGLFVMMCVGIIIGIVVLFIEHGVFKWLVPYYRMKPGASFWKSSHVMFFSQRLHRSITSAELLSAHESAKELIGLVKNREFARLFQKSTIRKNKLADMAKTKRINRNFYDIVEKAKCRDDSDGSIFNRLHEMKEMNLMDDGDDEPPPTIIEIPLKDLGAKIDSILPKPDDDFVDHVTIEDENSHSRELLLLEDPDRSLASQCRGTDNSSTLSNRSLERLFNEDNPSSSSSSPVTPNNATTYKTLNYCSLPTASGARFLESLPNGHIFGCGFEPCGSDSVANNRIETPSVLFKALTDDSHNYTSSTHCKSLLPKTNNMVRSLLHKTQSYQDHLCSVDDAVPGTFSIEKITKEELLIMWKTSEIELSKKLEQALREKAKLERKLAQLQHHSPV